MKNVLIILLTTVISSNFYSQNKNLSVEARYGSTKIKSNDFLGTLFSPQINYHFLKEKRANITTSLFLNSYSTKYISHEIALLDDGTPYLKEIETRKKGAAYGFGISSHIKLFNLDKKFIPFIKPAISLVHENADKNSQTFGQITGAQSTSTNNNNYVAQISMGFIYNYQLEFGLFYGHLISEQKSDSIIPNYNIGLNISYMFNIPFIKKSHPNETE